MKIKISAAHIIITAMLAMMASCKSKSGNGNSASQDTGTKATTQPVVQVPEFNADTTYDMIKKQVDFGYRIPNTKEHDACANYIVKKLKQYCKNVEVQEGEMAAYDGTKLKIKNIFAYYNPNATRKILITSHYDSRPWNDQDSGVASGKVAPKKILAANDAGSGVAVMLEMARQFSLKAPDVGIILFFNDAEDYGTPYFAKDREHEDETYCLGVQYWAKHLDKTKYYAEYGILLDMVGAKNSRFLQELRSINYAPNQMNKIWGIAQMLGYRSNFIVNQTAQIVDDHKFVTEMAAIPCLDIVDYDHSRGGFGKYWHTTSDDMNIIDKNVLKAVGQTLLYLLYNEKTNS